MLFIYLFIHVVKTCCLGIYSKLGILRGDINNGFQNKESTYYTLNAPSVGSTLGFGQEHMSLSVFSEKEGWPSNPVSLL